MQCKYSIMILTRWRWGKRMKSGDSIDDNRQAFFLLFANDFFLHSCLSSSFDISLSLLCRNLILSWKEYRIWWWERKSDEAFYLNNDIFCGDIFLYLSCYLDIFRDTKSFKLLIRSSSCFGFKAEKERARYFLLCKILSKRQNACLLK